MSGNAPAGAGRAVWKARDAADRETSHHAGLSTSRDEAVRTQYESSVAAADYAAAQGGWGRYARYHHSRLYVVDQVLRGCPGGDLLDVGCGPGILVRHLLDTRNGDFRITACDRSQAMIDAVAQRVADADGVHLTVGRIENMPYSDGSFDIALVLGVLEYTDCASGVREIARVVRPGGMVVVTMLNPASPYRLFEWFVYWPARRVLAGVERLLGIPPERRHGARRSGIRAVRRARLIRIMRQAGLQPQDVIGYDVTWLVPPLDTLVLRLFQQWRRHPERTVSRGWGRWLGTAYLVVARRSVGGACDDVSGLGHGRLADERTVLHPVADGQAVMTSDSIQV